MSLPLKPPVEPILARPAKSNPDSSKLFFEPKWDFGFGLLGRWAC
jgi:hypothetical protein